jgi:hypothetical protein
VKQLLSEITFLPGGILKIKLCTSFYLSYRERIVCLIFLFPNRFTFHWEDTWEIKVGKEEEYVEK